MSSSTAFAPVPAARSIIYLDMDVHKESITIAVLPDGAKAPTRLERMPNDLPKLKKWIERAARAGEVRACYEASGAGYVLHRALQEWGYACEAMHPVSRWVGDVGSRWEHDSHSCDDQRWVAFRKVCACVSDTLRQL